MNNIGRLVTFPQLFKEEADVVIPKVQRDYAYGREEKRVQEILTGLLGSILDAVNNNNEVILDFIYGGAHYKEDEVTAGLIPLDGQQRLTTLFLLYFYASLLDGVNISFEEVNFLSNFRYDTRQSANEFCKHLVTDIRQDILQRYDKEHGSIKKLITDHPLYLMNYDNDPTIVSMLNVLVVIENMCREKGLLHLEPSLWRRLIDRDNIKFYTLSLNDFGLTDDLYIKMNSRGKRLTPFEIFKADVMAAIKVIDDREPDESQKQKNVFSNKMDSKWIDIVWNSTDKHIDEDHKASDVTEEADSRYSWLFKNIFWLEYCLEGKDTKTYKSIEEVSSKKSDYIKEILSSKEEVLQVEDIFDVLYDLSKGQGLTTIWNSYFYSSDAVVGTSDKIRLFGRQRFNSVFEAAMQTNLSVPQTVYFYAVYLLAKTDYSQEEKFNCMRIVRNLMATNTRLEDARTDKLPGFLKEVKYVIDHRGIDQWVGRDKPLKTEIGEHKLAFGQNGWNEEFIKQHRLSDDVYAKVLKYENHDLLRASIMLFMEYCSPNSGMDTDPDRLDIDEEHLLTILDKFEKVFEDNYADATTGYFDKLRSNLMDRELEYMQWDANMDGNNDGTYIGRYFISVPWLRNYRQFFIRYDNRRNQDSLLKILEGLPLPNALKEPEEKSKEFSNEDWKYYLAKYPSESNYRDSRYGRGLWEDRANRPLELILLNSSQHGKYNLEWMMMNLTLFNMLGDREKFILDPHGCSPVVILANSSSIDFKQGGWIVKTYLNLPSLVSTIEDIKYEQIENEDNSYKISFISSVHDRDYIELGVELANIMASQQIQPTKADDVTKEDNRQAKS